MQKKRTIFQKIFIGFIALVVSVLTIYCSFILVYEYKTSKANVMMESVEISNKINQALRDYINQIDGTISSFYYELVQNNTGALASLLTSEEELTGYAKSQQLKSLNKYFSKLFVMRKDFVDVYIYSNERNNYVYSSYGGKTLNYTPYDTEWYQKTIEKNGKTNITIDYIAEQITYKKPVIGFSRMFKDVNGEGILDNTVIMLDFTMEKIEELFDTYIANDMTTLMLKNDKGDIIYQYGAENSMQNYWKNNRISSGAHMINTGDNRYIVASSDKKVYEWNGVIALDMNYTMAKIWNYLQFTIMLLGVLILGAAGISFAFAQNICRPIRILEQGMQTIQTGNFDIHLQKETNDEIGELIDHFNIMTAKIKQLIREKYEEEIQKKDAQYKFLQAQIDPHFIFNTLQIISSMSIVYKTPEIRVVSNSLAEVIRYSISGSEKTIYLKEEIKNVKCYLEIQKIRFKNRLSYEINMDSDLEFVSIIKLILQPIVENGISHGLKDKEENGIIRIHVFQKSDKVFITVSDNGVGMNKKELNDLMTKINIPIEDTNRAALLEKTEIDTKEKRNHVGLRNINLRLKMYYGDEYGLSISSAENSGTTITICIRK